MAEIINNNSMHAIIMVNLWSFVEGTGLAESNLGSLLPLKIQLIRYDCMLNWRNGKLVCVSVVSC